jgi:hypothetical protein
VRLRQALKLNGPERSGSKSSAAARAATLRQTFRHCRSPSQHGQFLEPELLHRQTRIDRKESDRSVGQGQHSVSSRGSLQLPLNSSGLYRHRRLCRRWLATHENPVREECEDLCCRPLERQRPQGYRGDQEARARFEWEVGVLEPGFGGPYDDQGLRG